MARRKQADLFSITFGNMNDEGTVERLIAALKSEATWARKIAAEALGCIGDSRFIEPLIEALNDKYEHVIEAAAEALVKIGKPSVEPLAAALKQGDPWVRYYAARALGQLGWEPRDDDESVQALVEALRHNDSSVRRAATYALGTLDWQPRDDGESVRTLVEALRDSDSSVRHYAARVLAELGWEPRDDGEEFYFLIAKRGYDACLDMDDRAVPWLITALTDNSPDSSDCRRAAARVLGDTGDKRAIKPLVATLKDEDSNVRREAANALEKLGWEPENNAEKAAKFIALKEWDKCAEIGDKFAIEALIPVLNDRIWWIANAAAHALAKISKPAVEPLIAALKSGNRRESWFWGDWVISALEMIGDERAVEPLMSILRDEENYSDHLRSDSGNALVKIGKPAVEPLIAALKEDDSSTRCLAADALGSIGDRRALEPLIAALKDNDPWVRSGSTDALGKLGDKRAVEPLVILLKEDIAKIRSDAANALKKLGWKPKTRSEKAACFVASEKWDECVKMGKPAIEPLAALMRENVCNEGAAIALDKLGWKPETESEKVAYFVASKKWDECVKMGSKCAIEAARGWLIQPTLQLPPNVHIPELEYPPRLPIRVEVAEALGKMGEQDAIEKLIDTLNHKRWRVRSRIVNALAETGSPLAVEPIAALLNDLIPKVRLGAASVLGRLGDSRAVEPLIAALKWPDEELRETITNALGRIGCQRAIDALIGTLRDEFARVRRNSAVVLGDMGDRRAVEPLIAALSDAQRNVRRQAVEALGKIGDKRALPALVAVLSDWVVGPAAAAVLDQHGWKAKSVEDQVHYLLARRDRAALLRMWTDTKRVLLGDIRSGQEITIQNAVCGFMFAEVEEMLQELEDLLYVEGDCAIAFAYMKCAKTQLGEAAIEWGNIHGYRYTPRVGFRPEVKPPTNGT